MSGCECKRDSAQPLTKMSGCECKRDSAQPLTRRRLMRVRTLHILGLVLGFSAATAALTAQQTTAPPALVTEREILDGLTADGSRWLTFGGNYSNQRYSPLTQIAPANVNRLIPQWTFQTGTLGNFETTSLFRDNVLYVTGPQNVAWALDA